MKSFARTLAYSAIGLSLTLLVGAAQATPVGIWISPEEIQTLPMSGPAWQRLVEAAGGAIGAPDISDQNDDADVIALAKALVYSRTGNSAYRDDVILACQAAIGTEQGGRTLALGRNLIGFVLAADLVGLPPEVDQPFRAWLGECLTKPLDGKTLVSTHNDRPNNWGTHAGASRMAVARYLGDDAELAIAANVFRGWLGDRQAYAGFQFGDLFWQDDPASPVGINPLGATKQGHDIDGVLPDDQRRGGSFSWPPPQENYVYEALQGALAQAVILSRAGYDAFEWQDQALKRAFLWLHGPCAYPATGDDTWEPHVVNHYYGTSFPAPVPSNPGKNVGWTDWTHAGVASGEPEPEPEPEPGGPTVGRRTLQPITRFEPADDGHVNSSRPDNSYGDASLMRVRAGNPAYRCFLKFRVSGLTGTVTRAKLRLYVTDGSNSGGSLYAVDNTHAGTNVPWTEDALTWDNAPPISGSPLATAGEVSSGTWVTFDVAPVIDGNGTYSFAMDTMSSNSAYYSTKEGATPPRLVIRTVSMITVEIPGD